MAGQPSCHRAEHINPARQSGDHNEGRSFPSLAEGRRVMAELSVALYLPRWVEGDMGRSPTWRNQHRFAASFVPVVSHGANWRMHEMCRGCAENRGRMGMHAPRNNSLLLIGLWQESEFLPRRTNRRFRR